MENFTCSLALLQPFTRYGYTTLYTYLLSSLSWHSTYTYGFWSELVARLHGENGKFCSTARNGSLFYVTGELGTKYYIRYIVHSPLSQLQFQDKEIR